MVKLINKVSLETMGEKLKLTSGKGNNLIVFAGIMILTCMSCTSSETANTDGVYLYLQSNEALSTESNIIELTYERGKIVSGYMWCTSDEFDWGREGYMPGFSVIPMSDIAHNDDTLTFTLNPDDTHFFSSPVDVTIHSAQEALDAGYNLWILDHAATDTTDAMNNFRDNYMAEWEFPLYGIDCEPITYTCLINPDSTIAIIGKSRNQFFLPNIFTPCSLEELQNNPNRELNTTYEHYNRKASWMHAILLKLKII